MKISSKVYDILKWVALICLPAIQVFWLQIADVWHLDYALEIGKTIGAVALLIGTLIGVSTYNYRAEKLQDNVDLSDENILDEGYYYENPDNDTEEQ